MPCLSAWSRPHRRDAGRKPCGRQEQNRHAPAPRKDRRQQRHRLPSPGADQRTTRAVLCGSVVDQLQPGPASRTQAEQAGDGGEQGRTCFQLQPPVECEEGIGSGATTRSDPRKSVWCETGAGQAPAPRRHFMSDATPGAAERPPANSAVPSELFVAHRYGRRSTAARGFGWVDGVLSPGKRAGAPPSEGRGAAGLAGSGEGGRRETCRTWPFPAEWSGRGSGRSRLGAGRQAQRLPTPSEAIVSAGQSETGTSTIGSSTISKTPVASSEVWSAAERCSNELPACGAQDKAVTARVAGGARRRVP